MATYQITLDNWSNHEEEIQNAIAKSRFIVALTGAGISKASGLPLVTERIDGVELRKFFNPELIQTAPERFYSIYRHALTEWRKAQPNAAHRAIAQQDIWVITQNIDGLHRDAGTERLIELHGNLRELLCTTCQTILGSELAFDEEIPRCPSCSAMLFPGVSLEGQEIRHYSRAVDWVGRAEVLIIVGTQLDMHPVRDIPMIAEQQGADIVWINESAEVLVPKMLQKPSNSDGN